MYTLEENMEKALEILKNRSAYYRQRYDLYNSQHDWCASFYYQSASDIIEAALTGNRSNLEDFDYLFPEDFDDED